MAGSYSSLLRDFEEMTALAKGLGAPRCPPEEPASDTCDPDRITESCKIFRSNEPFVPLPDGTLIPNVSRIKSRSLRSGADDRPLIPQELPQAIPSARRARIQALFETAKERVIALLSQGGDTPPLRESIKKVRLISLPAPETDLVKGSAACSLSKFNATYADFGHAVSLCPQDYFLPDLDVLGLMAHEIGHSIDPKNGARGVYRIDPERLAREITPAMREAAKDPSRELDARTRLLAKLDFSSHGKAEAYAALDTEGVEANALVQSLKAKGVLMQVTNPIRAGEYPLASAVECLSSPSGGGFSTEKGDSDKPEIEEALPDLIRTHVLESYLKDQGLDAGQPSMPAKLAPLALAFSEYCGQKLALETPENLESPPPGEDLGPDTWRAMPMAKRRRIWDSYRLGPQGDSHASPKRRLEALLLRQPEIRRLMGCPATLPAGSRACKAP